VASSVDRTTTNYIGPIDPSFPLLGGNSCGATLHIGLRWGSFPRGTVDAESWATSTGIILYLRLPYVPTIGRLGFHMVP
jgi:hypothetical protein